MGRTITNVSFLVLAACIGAISACTLKDQEPPPLTGPSELALSLSITASPDVLTQDGQSQSVITVTARDENGSPLRDLNLRLDLAVNGTPLTTFGRLSTNALRTGSDGRATATFTSPGPPPAGQFDPGTVVTIVATPIGSNFDNTISRSASIALVPPPATTAPGSPVPAFSFSPANPRVGQLVTFDATASTDPDGSIVLYQWDLGEDPDATGAINAYRYTSAGMYFVTLTVTDNNNNKASTTKVIVVSP